MKYLTPIYLTLMNSFVEHSNELIKNHTINSYLSNIEIYRELRTLNVNAGRQTGKTQASIMFAKEWQSNGNDIVYIVHNISIGSEINDMLSNYTLPYSYERNKLGNITFVSIRNFLSDTCNVFRGKSTHNCLVIVDEPCFKLPDSTKLYESYERHIKPTTLSSNSEHPLFFIIGNQ